MCKGNPLIKEMITFDRVVVDGQLFLDQPIGHVTDLNGAVRAADGHQGLIDVAVLDRQRRAHLHDDGLGGGITGQSPKKTGQRKLERELCASIGPQGRHHLRKALVFYLARAKEEKN